MPSLRDAYRGASVLVGINADLLLFAATLAAALMAARAQSAAKQPACVGAKCLTLR